MVEPVLELSTLEMAFFTFSISVVLLLLCTGELHSITRAKARLTKLDGDEDYDDPARPSFPTSWSSNTGSMYGHDVGTKFDGSPRSSILDTNGFPCNRSDSPEKGSIAISLQMSASLTPDYEFMPSKTSNSGSNSEYYMAAAIKRALVNAPNSMSNMLQVPVKMLPFLGGGGGGVYGNAALKSKASSSDSGSTDAPAEGDEERMFVNTGAQNMGSTVAKVIDSREIVKRGKLYTLGARKLHEKSPKVKEREMTMTGYYLYYYDSYNMKREFALRKCNVEKMSAHATSGDVAGNLFYALRLEQGSDQLTIGSQNEEDQNEWHDAILHVVEAIRIEEIENDGEEEEFRHKGLPSFAEQSFLNPQLPNGVREKLETISNVRKRLTPFNAQSSSDSAPIGRRSNSIQAKLNDDHILSPLHGE